MSDKLRYWQEQVSLWKASGLKVRPYCRQAKISEPRFYYWRRELNLINERSKVSKSFIEIELPQSNDVNLGIELILTSGHKLKFNDSTSPKYLSQLIASLRDHNLC